MRGLTLRSVLACGLLAAVVVGGFVVLIVAIQNLRQAERADARTEAVLSTSAVLEKSLLDLETGLRGYLLSGQSKFLEPYHAALRAYPAQSRQLQQQTSGDPVAHGQVLTINTAIGGYVTAWIQPQISLSQRGLPTAQQTEASGGGKNLVDGIRQQFATFDHREEALAAAQRASSNRDGLTALIFGLAAAAASLVLITVAALAQHWFVVLPVHRLAAAFNRVRWGDLSARVPGRGVAEVGELARGFNTMAGELQAQRDEVEQQNAELQGQQVELENALESVEQEKAGAELLHQFSEGLASTSEVEAVAETALAAIGDQAHAEVGALYVLNEQNGLITLRASRGLRAGQVVAELEPGAGLAGRAIAEKRPVTSSYPETTLTLPGLVSDREILHEAHLPLRHRDQPIGVVSLGRSREEPFTPGELARLGDLSRSASVACAEALGVRRLEILATELRTLMNSTDEGIFRRDLSGRITFINRAALEQTGYQADELLGKNAHEALHHHRSDGSPYPAAECPLVSTVRSRASSDVTAEVFWRKDGTALPIDWSVHPLLDGDTVAGSVVTFHDITPQLLAERQLSAQYETARMLVNAESEDTALPRLLRATCDTLGWEIGLAWMTDDAGSGLRCVASHASPGREQQASFLFAETGRSGRGTARKAWQRGQPVLASGADPGDLAPGGVLGPALLGDLAVPIISGDQVIGVLEFFGHDSPGDAGLRGTVETIAAHFAQFCRRKRTEADAARVKDQFVATVSHELRTPLAAMDGWLHILLDGDPGPLTGEQHRFLTTVKRNSDRLMRLVGDLLLIGQMDAGRFTLDLGTVDVAAVAHDTATLFAGAAAEKDIGVRLDVADSVVVRGDRLRLGQLLANLLSNAIKFTPSGGKVTLRVADEGSACLVEVSDSGVGIPAAEREHLFERFYRASTAAGVSGSGLGLAISKAIAEAHEGSLRIADRSGPGTTFVVEIPAVVPAAAST